MDHECTIGMSIQPDITVCSQSKKLRRSMKPMFILLAVVVVLSFKPSAAFTTIQLHNPLSHVTTSRLSASVSSLSLPSHHTTDNESSTVDSTSSSIITTTKPISTISVHERAHSYSNERWNLHYQQLISYQQRHGHLQVPQLHHSSATDQSLAHFCRNVRSQYRTAEQHGALSEERIQQLDALGFVWNTHDAAWHAHFESLRAFYQQHGHCHVTAAHDRTLASWIVTQRRKYRKQQRTSSTAASTTKSSGGTIKGKELTPAQIDLLNSIHFCWNPREDTWWSMYHELQAFQQVHGHVRVPRSDTTVHPKLSSWVAHVRRACREFVLSVALEVDYHSVHVSGLDERRIEALRQISFCWLPHPHRPGEVAPADIFAPLE
jgi:hypothetical protein